jgi:hypothetical protein
MTTTTTKRRGGGVDDESDEAAPRQVVPPWIAVMIKCLEQYGILTVVFLIITIGLYALIQSPGYLQRNLEKYFFVMCLPLIILFFVILSIENTEGLAPASFKVISALVVVALLAWLYTETNVSYTFSLMMSWTVFASIALVALAFIYGYVVSEMRRWKGWPGFIAQVLFFLPCILHDLWAALMQELNLTSWSIYLAILLEVVLIVVYFYLPQITQSVMGTDQSQAIILANEPIRLRGQTPTSGSYQQLASSPQLFNPINGTYRQNYAISMWIYINANTQQMSGYETESQLFSYGFVDQAGVQQVKPMIRYYGGGTSADSLADRNKIIFYFTRYPPKTLEERNQWSHDVELLPQRWNYVVINYSNNEANLFMNGQIEYTCRLHDALPTYGPLDTISAGDPQGPGVHGGLCNVVYYKHTLTPEQIAFSYNLMKDRDPPLMSVTASSAPAPQTAAR